MLERGQLIMHKARVSRMTARAEGVLLWLRDRGTVTERVIGGRYVINCTGPESNYKKLNQPLLVDLFARGLAHPDPLFLGLLTDAHGALINYLGQTSTRLFTIGSPRKGTLLESTAVPELRVQAEELARKLLQLQEQENLAYPAVVSL
jgi:uncharacterized NAD(P)/FAD-binding protein YdhS